MKLISKLHYITTNADMAEQACKGGVKWIQLRLKNVSDVHFFTVAKEVQTICKKHNATFIINDNVQLALELKADGVHLGKEDTLPQDARAILGNDFIIGSTANTIEDVTQLSKMPINYIGLGPYKFTDTKQNLSPVLGLKGYIDIINSLNNIKVPPIIAIGGIRIEDTASILNTGVYGIAVSGAITFAPNIADAARSFIVQLG